MTASKHRKIENKKNDASKLSDNELIALILKDNDSRLFGVVYDRYANIVYNKCLSFVKSKDEAQDLTQDIFIKLYFKLKSFKGESKFSTWLYSFTYNFCVNYLHRKYQKDQEMFKSLDYMENEIPEEISDGEIYKMQAERLQIALQTLEPKNKMILLMKYMDGMSLKEIQAATDLGESAVKMRLNRAKTRLLDIYNEIDS
ncbi:DNA-directed RNA polymerase sigma-70 factor [Echinicola pacifica]|uniref:DNA-directed RNA polymerase sigma-70 factor n=1 Tax=Echinicola pacifica TaxID=346377 RepID=A0A918UYF6_9BACT|nr:RNA polymerase sigma factor [Echinicola pacifica]GGZ42158.1 DNA-directed RNA polymerase sigma-70 factor [Echinicola pacifica]